MNSTGLAEAGHVRCTWGSIKVPISHGLIKNLMRLLGSPIADIILGQYVLLPINIAVIGLSTVIIDAN